MGLPPSGSQAQVEHRFADLADALKATPMLKIWHGSCLEFHSGRLLSGKAESGLLHDPSPSLPGGTGISHLAAPNTPPLRPPAYLGLPHLTASFRIGSGTGTISEEAFKLPFATAASRAAKRPGMRSNYVQKRIIHGA
jgi:hypothetical protein